MGEIRPRQQVLLSSSQRKEAARADLLNRPSGSLGSTARFTQENKIIKERRAEGGCILFESLSDTAHGMWGC